MYMRWTEWLKDKDNHEFTPAWPTKEAFYILNVHVDQGSMGKPQPRHD